jgi:hypothetical protein
MAPMLVFLHDGSVVNTVVGAQTEHVLRGAVERLTSSNWLRPVDRARLSSAE